MHRRTFIRSTLAASIVAATFGLTAPAHAEIEEGKLVVWINGDKGYDGLQQVGDWFTEETGIAVEVAHPDSATDKFQQSAATGNGPDIFIWAHDRFGEWAQSGIISEVKPSRKVIAANYDFTWDAVTVDGKKYGYPMAVESIGLIYNKDLLPEPPAAFEEIPAVHEKLAADGKGAILWDYNNTYFTWPLLAANGGYVFAKTEGGYDVGQTGVNSTGAKQGAQTLKALIDAGVMPKGADYSAAEAAFNKGESAMFISGPWAWANAKKSGIDFGVAPIPAVGDALSRPFTGVMAATLSAASPNRALAVEFL
ncbi:MAG TPA: maltose/maltodextrin ABC transporter substrate-binding protein MalE, partial [Desulfurivibrionaceae bacterium]|nr:maltose/maltodextrin ABC transporter substrate-binding protein MalE [Desulfurivibrionaceae bacterium]